MNAKSYNRGKLDGINSIGFKNPIHNNWSVDQNGKFVHFDRDYLKGYVEGFKQSGIDLSDKI